MDLAAIFAWCYVTATPSRTEKFDELATTRGPLCICATDTKTTPVWLVSDHAAQPPVTSVTPLGPVQDMIHDMIYKPRFRAPNMLAQNTI